MSKKNAKPTKPKPTPSKTARGKSARDTGGQSKRGGSSGRISPAGKSASGKSSKNKAGGGGRKIIADNRKARHRYEVIDSIECGLILRGSEVKSLREGKCQLDEAYGRVQGQTLWLVGCNISEYPQATFWNHEPKRPRQLLVHKREMQKWIGKAKEKGLTLVPLRMYFNERGIVKCEMALCKGLKLHDKRDKMKKASAQRDMDRAMRWAR